MWATEVDPLSRYHSHPSNVRNSSGHSQEQGGDFTICFQALLQFHHIYALNALPTVSVYMSRKKLGPECVAAAMSQ